MSQVSPGDTLLLPCEVRGGPFRDEKMIRICVPNATWVGFVKETFLSKNNQQWEVRAQVVEVKGETLFVRIPGHSPTGSLVKAPTKGVDSSGSIDAFADEGDTEAERGALSALDALRRAKGE